MTKTCAEALSRNRAARATRGKATFKTAKKAQPLALGQGLKKSGDALRGTSQHLPCMIENLPTLPAAPVTSEAGGSWGQASTSPSEVTAESALAAVVSSHKD